MHARDQMRRGSPANEDEYLRAVTLFKGNVARWRALAHGVLPYHAPECGIATGCRGLPAPRLSSHPSGGAATEDSK